MKRLITILLVLLLSVSMCACEGVTKLEDIELPPLPDVNSTEAPAEVTVEPVVLPSGRTIAYFNHVSEECFDPETGEKLILSFSYDALTLHIDGKDQIADKINEYIAMVDETYYTGNDYGVGSATGKNRLLELAEDNYQYARENNLTDLNMEYSAASTIELMRVSGNVISIRYNNSEYTGGAHGVYGYEAYVFDVETGERLSIDSLSADPTALKQALTDKMVQLAATEEYSALIDSELVPTEKLPEACAALLRDGSWYFDNDGIVIFPDLYEISGYAAGILEFTIPYSELEGLIDAKWLAPERTESGEFSVQSLEAYTDGTTEIIDKVSADEEGVQLVLTATGTVYDVKLSRVEYSDKFYETGRVWYCSEMNDCAVQIVTVIPEGMPDLMVSYRTPNGELVRQFISESGKDGSIILVDDSIEAVG